MYDLIHVTTEQDWLAYHAIRRKILFEDRGRTHYRDDVPDEYLPDKYLLLLKFNSAPIGTTRLDNRLDGTGIVRMVAITEQRKGHGRVLSDLTDDFAHQLGIHTLYVNAASDAVEFYRKTGWSAFIWDTTELTGSRKTAVQLHKVLSS